MRYIDTGEQYVPKHCIYGPRPAEGIVLNNLEWWSITDYLVEEERERQMAAVQRAKEEAKKQISLNMTKNWTNTLASIKNQGNQKRIEKIKKEKQDKIDEYNEILKSRKEEKKEILSEVRKILYENKDSTKTINSGILYSVVLQERQKQLELKKMLDAKKAKDKAEFEAKIRKDAEEYAKEKEMEKNEEKMRKLRQKQFLDEQMADIKRRKQMEAEEFEREKEDLKNMQIEGEKIANCNLVERNYRKDFAAKYCKKTQNQLEFEENIKLEQEEEDGINNIYLNYKRRFEHERKEKEEKMQQEKVKQRMKIAEELAKVLIKNAQAEEDRLLAAASDKELEAQREEENKERLRRELKADLVESKKKAEEKRARELYEDKERKKWELIQGYRSAEVDEEWRKFLADKMKQTKEKTRAAYDAQCKEYEERRANELKEWLTPLEDEAADKEELSKYCQEALGFVKEHNMPPYPTLKAIEKIKKENGIWDEKDAEKKEEKEGGQGKKKHKQTPLGSMCYCLKY